MNYQPLDSKLKRLIQICKETSNYKKLAVASFILTSNIVDEIGIKLGLNARLKEKGESIYNYLHRVNTVVEENAQVPLFSNIIMETIHRVEPLFLKKRGDISLEYIQQMYEVYYNLRNLNEEVPNVYEATSLEESKRFSPFRMLSFLSGKEPMSKKGNRIKPLLLHKIQEQEYVLQQHLSQGFEQDKFKSLLQLKTLRKSLNENKGKIVLKGSLKDNIIYTHTIEDIIKFAIIGCFLLFSLVGGISLIEMVLYPSLTPEISFLLLIELLVALACILIYKNYKKKS